MEVLATGAASELPLLVVRGQVEGQVSGGDEGFGAQAAAVGVQADAAVRTPAVGGDAAAAVPRLAGRALGGTVRFVRPLLSGRGRGVGGVRVRLGPRWAEGASAV